MTNAQRDNWSESCRSTERMFILRAATTFTTYIEQFSQYFSVNRAFDNDNDLGCSVYAAVSYTHLDVYKRQLYYYYLFVPS